MGVTYFGCWVTCHRWPRSHWWWASRQPWRNAAWRSIDRRKTVCWITRNWARWSCCWTGSHGRNNCSVHRNWCSVSHWSWRKIDWDSIASKTEDRWGWKVNTCGDYGWDTRAYCGKSHNDSLWRVGWGNNRLVWSDCECDDRGDNDGCRDIRSDVCLGHVLGRWRWVLPWWHSIANSASISSWSGAWSSSAL